MAKRVIVYTMDYCPYCDAAKNLLKQRGVPFEEIHIDKRDTSAWEPLMKRSGMRTLPQIFADDQLIGGFDSLSDLDKKDQLQSLKK